jgi:hypothetical protein
MDLVSKTYCCRLYITLSRAWGINVYPYRYSYSTGTYEGVVVATAVFLSSVLVSNIVVVVSRKVLLHRAHENYIRCCSSDGTCLCLIIQIHIELYKSLAQILQRLGKREVHDMLDYKNVAIIYPTN